MKHTYQVVVYGVGKMGWLSILQGSRDFCLGYLHAKENLSPRLAHRVIRSDAKVIAGISASDEVSIGQFAGYPAPEQYEQAAERAMAFAAAIREREKRQSEMDMRRKASADRSS